MTQEEKQLGFQDLYARLPYGVKAQVLGWDEEKGEVEVNLKIYSVNTDGYVYFEINDYDVNYLPVENVRPYLRPMSSMTEEEKVEYTSYCFEQPFLQKGKTLNLGSVPMCIDWLNAHHFDYRDLIQKGLADEAPEEMYDI